MEDQFLKQNREDEVKLEGIFENGYGTIPKIIARDPSLPIESKAIYGYIASFCGGGSSSFPGRDLVVSELSIGKNRYYKYFNILLERDYIKVKEMRKSGRHSNNLYVVTDKPEYFRSPDKWPILSEGERTNYLEAAVFGVSYCGYGNVAKKVMRDKSISIEAKGIYVYLASYTGKSTFATPSIKTMQYELSFKDEDILRKYIEELVNHGYIKKSKIGEGKKHNNNKYIIITGTSEFENPDRGEEGKKKTFYPPTNEDTVKNFYPPTNEDTVKNFYPPANEDTVSEVYSPINEDMANKDTVNEDTVFGDTNNNNNTNNSIINNNPSILSTPTDRWMEIAEEYIKTDQFPWWLIQGNEDVADHFSKISCEHLINSNETSDLTKAGAQTLESIIREIFTSDASKRYNIGDGTISAQGFCKLIAEKGITKFEEPPYASMVIAVENTIFAYGKAAEKSRIKNAKSYLRTILYNQLVAGDLETYSLISHDFSS